jgi:hypothetical protein
MKLDAQLATKNLEARLAEELEERTEFCDWVSVCTTCAGTCCGSTTTCTTGPSSTGTVCTTTPSKGW